MSKSSAWKPLHEAYAHVLARERDPRLTKHLLRTAFAEGSVRTRGYHVPGDFDRPGGVELMVRGLWAEPDRDHWAPTTVTEVDWTQDRADVSVPVDLRANVWGQFEILRIEACWEDLLKRWPMHGLKRGRKPVHDSEAILRAAEAFVQANGCPASLNKLVADLEVELADKLYPVPGRTFLRELLSPEFDRWQVSANSRN
jgi:hypothetical protein